MPITRRLTPRSFAFVRSPSLRDFLHLQRRRALTGFSRDECDLQHLLQRLHRVEFQNVPHFFRDILDVRLISLRQNDCLDAGAVSAKHLFLQSTNWEHTPTQRDLAGHRNVLSNRPFRHLRDQRRRDRDSC